MSGLGRSAAAILSLVLAAAAATSSPGAAVAAPDAAPAAAAEARTVRDALEAIQADLVALRFEKALRAIRDLLAEPSLSEAERAEALVLRAQAHVASGDLARAEADYREILALRPGFKPDASLTPSKAMARFEKVRRATVGTLKIEDLDPPDAHLEIDGRAVALAADGTVPLLAGTRVLSASRRGYDPLEIPLEIQADQVATTLVRLVPNARTVVVRTEPEGVAVRLDGVEVGRTARSPSADPTGPAQLVIEDLPLGEHAFEFTLDCHRDERFRDLLTVDLLDRRPKVYDPVFMEPVRARLVLRGGPAGAEVRIGDSSAGRLPLDPVSTCPGSIPVEVRSSGRIVWRDVVEAAAGDERILDLAPRPNAVRVGESDWPPGYEALGAALSVRTVAAAPEGKDLSTAEGWREVTLPPDTDLAFAAIPAGPGAPSRRVVVHSPLLGTVAVLPTEPPPARPPAWHRATLGVRLADSRLAGGARVVEVLPGGPASAAGVAAGERLVAVGGGRVGNAREATERIARAAPGRPLEIRVEGANGTPRALECTPSRSAWVREPGADAAGVRGALTAAWAAVAAAAVPEDAAAALANLGVLLSRTGRHERAAEVWRRIGWAERRGLGEGTAAYYLGRELEALGLEREAREAFARASRSASTAFDDDGPEIAPAARDHLRDLGVAPPARSTTAR